jgi:hypothetical protein
LNHCAYCLTVIRPIDSGLVLSFVQFFGCRPVATSEPAKVFICLLHALFRHRAGEELSAHVVILSSFACKNKRSPQRLAFDGYGSAQERRRDSLHPLIPSPLRALSKAESSFRSRECNSCYRGTNLHGQREADDPVHASLTALPYT